MFFFKKGKTAAEKIRDEVAQLKSYAWTFAAHKNTCEVAAIEARTAANAAHEYCALTKKQTDIATDAATRSYYWFNRSALLFFVHVIVIIFEIVILCFFRHGH